MRGDTLTAAVVAFALLAAVVFVVVRVQGAEQRGEDPSAAAAEALRVVGPPLAAVALTMVVAGFFVTVAGFLFVIALVMALGGDDSGFDAVVLFVLLASIVLFAGAGGALWWAVSRARRSRG